jgi:Fe-S-cluster containining protein
METETAIPDTPDHCRRCGTCCLKGGPVLHREDLELVRKGAIPLRDLITICPGEPVHDNVKGRIRQTENDRIKIQPRKGSTTCRYYDSAQRACTIYPRRPIQCRVLKCWEPAPLEALYDQDHLTRKDLLGEIPGLWDLVKTHGRRCDAHDNARRAARYLARSKGWQKAEAELLESLRYDQSLRDLVHAQGRPDPALLPFLLGRPLLQRLAPLRLRLIHSKDRYRLEPL